MRSLGHSGWNRENHLTRSLPGTGQRPVETEPGMEESRGDKAGEVDRETDQAGATILDQ